MDKGAFGQWLEQKLEREGWKGDELEGKMKEYMAYLPKDLQKLAEDAKFRTVSRNALELYITSLSDPYKSVQMKRMLLQQFLDTK